MNAKTTPKDFFTHLGTAIALYVSTVALIDLAFAIVNTALPDALARYLSASSIVRPISMLIILVPTLYVLEWLISRDFVRMPKKKDIWVRRWRIYLTLFLTGAVIAGDLIVLVNTYLNGEVTGRFIWKVLIVLVITGAVFKYYLFDRMRDSKPAWSRRVRTIISWAGIVCVLTAIVTGFVIIGSPAHQRALRFDEQRVSDLSNIQYQVLSYWQRTGNLPASIQSLEDPLSGFSISTDPETGSPYGYSIETATSSPATPIFRICASFSLPSSSESPSSTAYTSPVLLSRGLSDAAWDHPAGRACFDRTIDPTIYPPQTIPAVPVTTQK